METNILVGLYNLINNPIVNIKSFYLSKIRANGMGEALEYYIKDLLCNSLEEKNLSKKNEIYSKYFSYLGNQNNPPDIIIRNGDAIEVKKIESFTSGIALNSSYPKNKLYANSPMITQACASCENWREKDIIYIIGVTIDNKLRSLWAVYGDCYAADRETYEKIRTAIAQGLNELPNIEFSTTKELGRVNRVDPLGITYLRIRGMWGIDNPAKVFDYISEIDTTKDLNVNVLMLKEKYLSFSELDRKKIEAITNKDFQIKDVKIKSPNNAAKLLDAKLLRFVK